jgi:hypothetical protein
VHVARPVEEHITVTGFCEPIFTPEQMAKAWQVAREIERTPSRELASQHLLFGPRVLHLRDENVRDQPVHEHQARPLPFGVLPLPSRVGARNVFSKIDSGIGDRAIAYQRAVETASEP